jgi:hypothetical protein
MAIENIYGGNFDSIDKTTVLKMTVIIKSIYPMVLSKTWLINKLYSADKIVAGSTVDLDLKNYTMDINGSMRLSNGADIYGNVSIYNSLYCNSLNVDNINTINLTTQNLDVSDLVNIDGTTNLNGSSNLNGIVYLNNKLINYNNTIYCSDNLINTYHNYIGTTTLIDVNGLAYIKTLITNNISSDTIKSNVYTSLSDNAGCSITNVINLAISNNNNTTAQVTIGDTDNPVKFDLCANSDTTGINYNGDFQLNNKMLDDNKFYLYGGGQIIFDGVSYFNNLDIGYNNDTDRDSTINTPINNLYKLNINGSVRIGNDLLIGGNITHYSDYKLKTNINKLNNCLNKINNINGYTYNRIDYHNDKIYYGLIAQEVEKEYPEIVHDINNIKSINYQSFTAILLESIKELNIKISELEHLIKK